MVYYIKTWYDINQSTFKKRKNRYYESISVSYRGFWNSGSTCSYRYIRRADIDVKTVSITGNKLVESAQNIKVEADELIENVSCDKDDVLFLPGGPGHKSYYKWIDLWICL